MKSFLMLAIAGAGAFFYFHNPAASNAAVARTLRPASRQAAVQTSTTAAAPTIVIASVHSSYNRWKSGPSAQTSLKYGPDAQTHFEPFAPDEQADWNNTPGCTMIVGPALSRR